MTIDADVARLRGALGDQLRHGEIVAGGREVRVVVGRQHRDRQDAQVLSPLRASTAACMVCG